MIFPKRESNPAVLAKLVERIKMTDPTSAGSSKTMGIYSDLIKLAAELARAEGVPDWSGHVFHARTPKSECRQIMKALRDADEAMRDYAVRLRGIADKLSAQMRSPDETSARTCKYTQADDDTLLYLTDCGREFWRKGTHDLYDFCHFCGGAVEEATAEKANACQCDPNPSIGGSSPCPVHDGQESEGEQS